MKHLKILGLAVVAVLAFAAVSSAAASAATFHTENAPATLSAAAQENQVFVTESGTVSCKKVSGHGTMSALSEDPITAEGIDYKECTTSTIFGNIEVTVDFTTNHCDYTFHASGTVDLICDPGSSGVTISGPGCTVTVPTQEGLESVSYVNNEDGTVTIVPAVSNITSTGSGFLCSKTGTFHNGSYKGKVKITGNNGAISVS